MAGCRSRNSFGPKTADELKALSQNILVGEPTVEGMAEQLIAAANLVNSGDPGPTPLNLARSWAEVLEPVAKRVEELMTDPQ